LKLIGKFYINSYINILIKNRLRLIYGSNKGVKMKEVTIYDKRIGLIKVDVSELGQTQYVMLLIALNWDVGLSCSELSYMTDLPHQNVFKYIIRLHNYGYIKKVKLNSLSEELREYLSLFKKNKRIRAYYFPTKKGIRYIKHILKKNNLDILLLKIPDVDELIV